MKRTTNTAYALHEPSGVKIDGMSVGSTVAVGQSGRFRVVDIHDGDPRGWIMELDGEATYTIGGVTKTSCLVPSWFCSLVPRPVGAA